MMNHVKTNEDNSMLGWLYDQSRRSYGQDPQNVQQEFEMLYESLAGIALDETDQLVLTVRDLCEVHARAAFADGVKIGVRLARDLELDGHA